MAQVETIAKFGIIGTGRVAQLHAEAMARIEGAKLIGAWNRTPETCATFCKTYGGKQFKNIDDLLADPNINAVIVATISRTHYGHARQALLAGKHVMLEKPIAVTVEEIQDLKAISEQTGKICFPSHNYIYSEQMRSLKYHFDRGALGKLLSYWCLFNNQHPPSFGDPDVVMRELMIHHVYSMLHFAGRPRSVTATAGNVHFSDPHSPDQIMITCQFENGALANLWGSFAINDDRVRDPWSVVFKVMGSAGAAIVSWDAIKCGAEPEPLWDDMAYRDSFMHAQRFFTEECLGRGIAPLSMLDDADDALRILNAARQSIKEGRRIDVVYGMSKN